MYLDYHEIAPFLFQGSLPPISDPGLKVFDTIVLCAGEYQPNSLGIAKQTLIKAPMGDPTHPSEQMEADNDFKMAEQAGAEVAKRVKSGQRVLVTCFEGRNRSGTVVALALWHLTGKPGFWCVHQVKAKRKALRGEALTNPNFVSRLMKLTGRRAA